MNFVPPLRVSGFYSWTFQVVFLLFQCTGSVFGQAVPAISYTMQDVLAHNDYQKENPFYDAWKHGVGIIEADLYFHEGEVLVAHDRSELKYEWDLENIYLKPMLDKVDEYGSIYPDSGTSLALMLDIKNQPEKIMDWILEIVKKYPELFGDSKNKPKAKLVISGLRPPISTWAVLPAVVFIDGRLSDDIPPSLRHKVYMVSSSLASVIPGSWSPAQLTSSQTTALKETIDSVHSQNLKMRFWGVPDNLYFWELQSKLGVDIIGSDHLDELAKVVGSRK